MDFSFNRPAIADEPGSQFITRYGRPSPPDWRGMTQDFRDLLGLAWDFLLDKTYEWPFKGATMKRIVHGVGYYLPPREVKEIVDMVRTLVVEGFVRKRGSYYLLRDKRIYGKKYTTTWGGKAFARRIPADEYYGRRK